MSNRITLAQVNIAITITLDTGPFEGAEQPTSGQPTVLDVAPSNIFVPGFQVIRPPVPEAPPETEAVDAVTSAEPEEELPSPDELPDAEEERPSSLPPDQQEVVERLQEAGADLQCVRCHKNPIFSTKTGLCRSCSGYFGQRERWRRFREEKARTVPQGPCVKCKRTDVKHRANYPNGYCRSCESYRRKVEQWQAEGHICPRCQENFILTPDAKTCQQCRYKDAGEFLRQQRRSPSPVGA